MPNRRILEDENGVSSCGKLISSELKESFMEAVFRITKSVNQDLKNSFQNELVENEFHKHIEAFGERESVQNQFKMKREKSAKHFQAYQASLQKVQKDREEVIELMQEQIQSFDNFMNILDEKVLTQKKAK